MKPKSIAKRITRIKKANPGMSTAAAGKVAVKRAKAYQSGMGPTSKVRTKAKPVPAKVSLSRAVAYAKAGQKKK